MRATEKTQVRAKNASRDVNSRYRFQRKRVLAYDLSILGGFERKSAYCATRGPEFESQYSGKKLDMTVHAPVTQCCGKGGTEDQWTTGLASLQPSQVQ